MLWLFVEHLLTETEQEAFSHFLNQLADNMHAENDDKRGNTSRKSVSKQFDRGDVVMAVEKGPFWRLTRNACCIGGEGEAVYDQSHRSALPRQPTTSAKESKVPNSSPSSGSDSDDSGTDQGEESGLSRRERKKRRMERELLSEDQKRANHIASEQKRRQSIREGFSTLVHMVPSLGKCHRSEAVILQKCKSCFFFLTDAGVAICSRDHFS
jgi:hypothetical protein